MLDEPPMRPMIIEPTEPSPAGNPDLSEWSLYDADFPREIDPRYRLADPTQTLHTPHFSISEVAVWAFARTPEWGKSVLSNKKSRSLTLPHIGELKFRRLAKGRSHAQGHGERRLTLADVERLAHALNARGDIDGLTLQRAHAIIMQVAEQYKHRRGPRS